MFCGTSFVIVFKELLRVKFDFTKKYCSLFVLDNFLSCYGRSAAGRYYRHGNEVFVHVLKGFNIQSSQLSF